MKILIICDMFPPAFGPRMGYLCKYMKRAGWEPVVVTEYIPDKTFSFLTADIDVTYIHYYKTTNKIIRKIELIFLLLRDWLFHHKDREMVKTANRLIKKGGFGGVLCSTYRTFPLPAAQEVAEKAGLPFIADLRDIVEQYASNEFISHSFHTFPWLDKKITEQFRNRLLKDRNKALKKADYITTVSPWHVETLKQYNPQTKLIYNGYDPEVFFPEVHKTTSFTVTYTGRMVSLATRDPRLLFEAVARLDKEKRITTETFRLRWYMDATSDKLITELAEAYSLSEYIETLGYVPAIEIPHVLNHSSVLLQLTNKMSATGPKGFMTTKLFEAMAVEKPLLCIRSDESFLEETIKRTETGVSARTAEEVYDFLLHYYTEWQQKGYTSIRPNRKEVEKFSRRSQAEQFMKLFTELNNG